MKDPDVEDIEIERNKPKWDSGLGYLILLDQEIKLVNGYLINAEWPEYYRSLEAWFITSIYWIEKSEKAAAVKLKDSDGKEISAIDLLKKIRGAADETQIGTLKKYHELLDKLTNIAGLRLASTTSMPGILKS